MATTTHLGTTPARAGRGGRAWPVAASVAVAVAVLGHVWVAWSSFVAGTPSFNFDEIASLMPGRAVAGFPTPHVGGAGYFPLQAVLTAPIWWLTSNPVVFYRVALVLSLVLGLAAIWPLSRIATRFGLTTAQAITVSAVVMALPARTVQAEYLLAEKPLFLVLALTGLAVVRLTERPTYARVLLVSVGVATAYFAHARMVTVVVAAVVWMLLLTLRHLRVGLVGLVSVVALSWAAKRLALHIIDLVTRFSQGKDFSTTLKTLRPGTLARTVLGQAWEQVVSTFGLAPLGVVVVVVLVVAEVRRRQVGPALFLLLATGALFAGSAIDWAQPEDLWPTTTRERLDVWIYGRYVDPLFGLVALVALCAIVVGVRRRQLWTGAALALGIVGATVLWLAPDAPTGGTLTPAHAPGAAVFDRLLPHRPVPTGMIPTLTNDGRFWLVASLVALVPVAVLLVARRRPLPVVAVVLALGATGTASANVASTQFHQLRAHHEPLLLTLRHIEAEHPGTTISYFWRCASKPDPQPALRNRYAWRLLPTVLGTDPHSDIVVACPAHPAAGQPGAVPLVDRAAGDYLAWVRPGPLQDALRAEGLLVRGRPAS